MKVMIGKAKFLLKETKLRIDYMTSHGCIFCKIISGEIKSNLLVKTGTIVAFADINPVATVHIVIVPKKHIESVLTIGKDDGPVLVEMFNVAKKLSLEQKLDAWRLAFNAGRYQHVPHLHMHLLAGGKVEWKRL